MASMYPSGDVVTVMLDGVDLNAGIADASARMDFDVLQQLLHIREVKECLDCGQLSEEDYRVYWLDFQAWRNARIDIEKVRHNAND